MNEPKNRRVLWFKSSTDRNESVDDEHRSLFKPSSDGSLSISSLFYYVPYSVGAAASTRVSNELGSGNAVGTSSNCCTGCGNSYHGRNDHRNIHSLLMSSCYRICIPVRRKMSSITLKNDSVSLPQWLRWIAFKEYFLVS